MGPEINQNTNGKNRSSEGLDIRTKIKVRLSRLDSCRPESYDAETLKRGFQELLKVVPPAKMKSEGRDPTTGLTHRDLLSVHSKVGNLLRELHKYSASEGSCSDATLRTTVRETIDILKKIFMDPPRSTVDWTVREVVREGSFPVQGGPQAALDNLVMPRGDK